MIEQNDFIVEDETQLGSQFQLNKSIHGAEDNRVARAKRAPNQMIEPSPEWVDEDLRQKKKRKKLLDEETPQIDDRVLRVLNREYANVQIQKGESYMSHNNCLPPFIQDNESNRSNKRPNSAIREPNRLRSPLAFIMENVSERFSNNKSTKPKGARNMSEDTMLLNSRPGFKKVPKLQQQKKQKKYALKQQTSPKNP